MNVNQWGQGVRTMGDRGAGDPIFTLLFKIGVGKNNQRIEDR